MIIRPQSQMTSRLLCFRLYSDYIYETRHFGYNVSVQDFHETVLQTIRSHRHCQEKHPIRVCAYNSTIEPHNMKVSLFDGFESNVTDIAQCFGKYTTKIHPCNKYFFFSFENERKSVEPFYFSVYLLKTLIVNTR